jgi:hypothetical protein
MSTTSIYVLGKEPGEIGECRNAWRGAMYVWNDIAKRYCDLPSFPFDAPSQNKVWNANQRYIMPEHEQIVLLSTMDNAIVWARDAKTVAEAFAKYGREHPDSSLAEQAEILRTAALKPEDALAWQQTSVGEFWGQSWNDESEDYDYYDPHAGTKHFDVMSEVRRS